MCSKGWVKDSRAGSRQGGAGTPREASVAMAVARGWGVAGLSALPGTSREQPRRPEQGLSKRRPLWGHKSPSPDRLGPHLRTEGHAWGWREAQGPGQGWASPRLPPGPGLPRPGGPSARSLCRCSRALWAALARSPFLRRLGLPQLKFLITARGRENKYPSTDS